MRFDEVVARLLMILGIGISLGIGWGNFEQLQRQQKTLDNIMHNQNVIMGALHQQEEDQFDNFVKHNNLLGMINRHEDILKELNPHKNEIGDCWIISIPKKKK
jgi:hypothetical protein